jgi:hypothetical protein
LKPGDPANPYADYTIERLSQSFVSHARISPPLNAASLFKGAQDDTRRSRASRMDGNVQSDTDAVTGSRCNRRLGRFRDVSKTEADTLGGFMAPRDSEKVVAHFTQHSPALSWDDINEAGTYVSTTTGDLYRVPSEALVRGSSPIIRKQGNSGERFLRLSIDPLITTFEARMLSAEGNVKPNF